MANNLLQIKRTSVAGRAANTTTLPNAGELALNMPDQIMYSTDGATVFEIGANVGTQVVRTALYVGDNVDLTTTALIIGNTSINLIANSTTIKLSNATENTHISVPSASEYAGNYYLHANGSWVEISSTASTRVYEAFTATGGQTIFPVSGGYDINQIEVFYNGVHLANTEYTQDGTNVTLGTGALAGAIIEVAGYKDIDIAEIEATPGGGNTAVQYNDSSVIGGSAGFTFDETTNNVLIANTLTVGTATINSTNYTGSANNAAYLGGTVASDYALDSDLSSYQTTAGLAAAVAILPANSATYVLANNGIVSNSYGVWAKQANGITVDSGGINVKANTGIYVTTDGVFVNASYIGTISSNNATYLGGGGALGNTTGIYANSVVNAASHTVGTNFVANTTMANAVAFTTAVFVANATVMAVGANNIINTTAVGAGNAYFTGVVNADSHTSTNFVANTTGVYHSLMNAATFSVGTSSVVNSSLIQSGGSLLSANIQVTACTTTSYTLLASDSGKIVTMDNGSAMTVTIPAGLPIGFRCQVMRKGAGTCTMSNTGQTGAILHSRSGAYAITAQWGSASIFEESANSYVIDGLI